MLGALVGDIIGSSREFNPIKSSSFALFPRGSDFTDDSVMTCAVASALVEAEDYGAAMHALGRLYPGAGWGGRFRSWLASDHPRPYGSYGNGSAMRVSPVVWAFETEAEVLAAARASALPSHDHPEGIKGAEATALAGFLARKGEDNGTIRRGISSRFGYDLGRTVEGIRPSYSFDETCQRTVPEAIIAFLDAGDFEEAIRNAVSLGGDADTLAAITGSIAEARWGVPEGLLAPALSLLDDRLYAIALAFCDRWRPSEAGRLRALRTRAGGLGLEL